MIRLHKRTVADAAKVLDEITATEIEAAMKVVLDKEAKPVVESVSQSNPQPEVSPTQSNSQNGKNNAMTTKTSKTTKTSNKPNPKNAARKALMTGKCLCGCGAETKGLFAPGHDAKLHGMVLQAFKNEKVLRVGKSTLEYLNGTGWFTKELKGSVKAR